MTKPVTFKVSNVAEEFSVAIKSLSVPVAEAATNAIIEIGRAHV